MKTHDFHLLITNNLLKELNKIDELNQFTFSKKATYILNLYKKTSIVLKYLKIDDNSKVEYLSNKKDVHIYIKEKQYRKLKYYHSRTNAYSIALIVRMLIKIFIRTVNNYGFKNAMKKIKKECKFLAKICLKKNKKLILIQLLNYLKIKDKKNLKFEIILTKLLL